MKSFRELVGMEDVLLVVWYLFLHLKSRIHHSLKSSSKLSAHNAAKQQQQQQQQQRTCPTVDECRASSDSSLVCELEGALLRSSSPFAYLFLVAFEAGGGFPRAALVLAAYPLVWLLGVLASPDLAFRLLVFVSLCGVRESAVARVARAVLPKFYLGDLHPGAFRVLTTSGGRRCVVTSSPRKLVEPFLKDFLDVELVVGSELSATRGGYLTGFLSSRPAASDHIKEAPVGIGVAATAGDVTGISAICKEAYVVRDAESVAAVTSDQLPKPVVFHDGRFAIRPTPVVALVVFLWLPLGLVLAVPRMLVAVLCPNVPLIGVLEALLGIRIRMQGKPPKPCGGGGESSGVLFVCTHRMLVDPLFLSLCAGRRVTAVTYSISWISEALAPIRTLRLTRCRTQDAKAIAAQLAVGDLAVCPEGTTCREPYLLRFSPLFAELSDKIVPVALSTKSQFFHGSTARGWKALDPLFFTLNPFPSYQVHFLEMLPPEATVQHGGASSIDVANRVQRLLAQTLGYRCTSYSRRDKYQLLAGNDGVVEQRRGAPPAVSTRLRRYCSA